MYTCKYIYSFGKNWQELARTGKSWQELARAARQFLLVLAKRCLVGTQNSRSRCKFIAFSAFYALCRHSKFAFPLWIPNGFCALGVSLTCTIRIFTTDSQCLFALFADSFQVFSMKHHIIEQLN